MKELISNKELNELKSLKGELNGFAIKNNLRFILEKEGKKELEKLENTLAELGYPIKYRAINPLKFYPIAIDAVILSVIKKLFNYDEKKFQEMGEFQFKTPLILRLFARYFSSLEKILNFAPKLWKKYYSQGELKIIEENKEKKYIVARIENFYNHPLHCQILLGVIPTVVKMIVNGPVTCEETKCIHRGDEYHEFLIKW